MFVGPNTSEVIDFYTSKMLELIKDWRFLDEVSPNHLRVSLNITVEQTIIQRTIPKKHIGPSSILFLAINCSFLEAKDFFCNRRSRPLNCILLTMKRVVFLHSLNVELRISRKPAKRHLNRICRKQYIEWKFWELPGLI